MQGSPLQKTGGTEETGSGRAGYASSRGWAPSSHTAAAPGEPTGEGPRAGRGARGASRGSPSNRTENSVFQITEFVTVLHLFLKAIFKKKEKISGIAFNFISNKCID